ncbi:glycosyltransferase family 4 protein [Anabaena sphaerica FACHB-251]|uniref:Glycosyltransferase family 4 protein n=1 Tax=Anabaena sphaerica FACHB-251 TaxID=2692883 RepID=A0A926ZZ81_9NOST|nr:glycosyltransferase family 4 protein [Anabaena sphaerica]MBD2292369.1 glycosyltransferase family 4 protein [Anabaena sphaerica FACHB-251]
MQHINIAFHQSGSRLNYAIPLALHQQDLLYKLFTDFYAFSWMIKGGKHIEPIINPYFSVNDLLKRHQKQLPDEKICSLNLQWLLLNLRTRNRNLQYKDIYFLNQEISIRIAQLIKSQKKHISHVYCYTWNSSNCRQYVKNALIFTDQIQSIIKSFIPMLERELEEHSDWVKEKNMLSEVSELWTAKEKEDIETSDYFLAPSEFIKASLINDLSIDPKKIYLNPYPAPLWLYDYETSLNNSVRLSSKKEKGEELKIVFVGTVELRKGIQYLLKALRKINPDKFHARIVGSIQIHENKIKEYSDICTFMGQLNKQELTKQYEWADVFVFPSLSEGSAGVIYEAMAFGLPIITTKSSGSWVRDGIDGIIVQERNIEHLIEALLQYIEKPDLLESHGENAWNNVKSFSIEQTGIRLQNIFNTI